MTRITSASATHGDGSWPTYIGCSAEIAVAFAQYWHTGIDHCSAMRATRLEAGRRAGAALGDDERALGAGEQPRHLGDLVGRGHD